MCFLNLSYFCDTAWNWWSYDDTNRDLFFELTEIFVLEKIVNLRINSAKILHTKMDLQIFTRQKPVLNHNFTDDHRYLWIYRQHLCFSLQTCLPCTSYWYGNRTTHPLPSYRRLVTAFVIVIVRIGTSCHHRLCLSPRKGTSVAMRADCHLYALRLCQTGVK